MSPTVYRIVSVEGVSEANIQKEGKIRDRKIRRSRILVIIFVFPHDIMDFALKRFDFLSMINSKIYQSYHAS